MKNQKLSRRDFVKTGSAAAAGIAAPCFIPATVLGAADSLPPSEQVTVGHIGVGTRGSTLLEQTQKGRGTRSLAVADCYQDRRDRAAAVIHGDAHADFREILDRDDIDAVIIATPDHWHVPIALMAARAGKDVYVEKPLGLTLDQDLECAKGIAACGRIFQYGTQQREAAHLQLGRELIRSGKLGELMAIEVKAPNGGSGGSTDVACIPAGFDFDMWLGPAPSACYTVDRCKPQGSYWIYDHSIGYLGGWGAHPLDILVWCYDGDQLGPYTVEGSGVVPTEGLYDTVYDWDMTLSMADGVRISLVPGTDSTKFIGNDGRLELTRNSIRAFPEELLPSEDELAANDHFENTARHIDDFADAVRSRRPASSPIDDAVRSDVMSHLCDIAVRTKEKLIWDPVRKEIIGGSANAQFMTDRPMRKPWTL